MTNYEITVLGRGRYRCEGEGIGRTGSSKVKAHQLWLKTLVELQIIAMRVEMAGRASHPAAPRKSDSPGHTRAKMRFSMERVVASGQSRLISVTSRVRSFADTGNVRSAQ